MHKTWKKDTPEEQRCDAYAFYCQSLFVYGGKLYLVWSVPGTGKTSLIESEPDRSGQRVVAQVDSDYLGYYAIKDGSMYFCTLTSETKKDESGMPVQTGLSRTSFNRLDLKTGTVRLIKEMEQRYNGQLLIAGVYRDMILCCYGYFKEKFTGINYEEAGKQMKWFTYHTKDNDMKESFPALTDLDMGHCETEGEKLIYGKWRDPDGNRSDIYCYHIDTQENHKIISDSHSFSIDDHKVFARGYKEAECMIYDIASQTTELLVQEEMILHIRAEYENYFIVSCYENGESVYGIIPKEDYYNGSVNFKKLDAE